MSDFERNLAAVAEMAKVFDVTLTLDTSEYAEGDVFAAVQEVEDVGYLAGAAVVLQSLSVIDTDDNGRSITLYFFDADVSIGTENEAVSISDTDAMHVIGKVEVFASYYDDLIASKFAQVSQIALPLQCASNSTSLWVAAVYRDATGDTYTAEGLELKLGFLRGI